MNILVKRTKC